jgi:hypothetical protein
MHVLEKVAATLSRKFNVQVVFRGNSASTDGDTIYLPSLAESISEELAEKVKGYCDHEVGHIKYSDFKILQEIGFMDNAVRIKALTNMLEDIRSEGKLGREYIGCKENLNKLTNSLLKDEFGVEVDLTKPMAALFFEGRRKCNGFVIPIPDVGDVVTKIFGDDLFDKIGALDSSRDSLNLALEMLKKLEKDSKEPEQDTLGSKENGKGKSNGDAKKGEKKDKSNDEDEPEDDEDEPEDEDGKEGKEGKDGEDGEEGEEGEGGEGSDNVDPFEDNEGDKKEPKGSKAGTSAEQEGDDETAKDGKEDEDAEHTDDKAGNKTRTTTHGDSDTKPITIEEAMKTLEDIEQMEDFAQILKEQLAKEHKNSTRTNYVVYDKTKDEITTVPEASSARVYNDMRNELEGLNTVIAKMANLFLTRTASRWMNDREQGKINARGLCRVETGYRNVFKEKFMSQDANTAVTFLVDFSSSMLSGCSREGSNIDHAMKAVVVFLEALGNAKIKTEILGYTTGDKVHLRTSEAYSRNDYGRVENLVTYVFKAFNEPMTLKIKKRISSYRNSCRLKENCDPESVLIAAERLSKRPEKRKILFVLTDGCVQNRGNSVKGRKYLKEIVPKIEKTGIEVVGVGMGYTTAKEYYKRCIEVINGEKLAENLMNQIKNILKVKC